MNNDYKYYNFKQGVNAPAKLLTLEEIEKIQPDNTKDYYTSIFRYNDYQKKQLEEKKSLSGIKDVRTNTLVWDFDDSNDPENARLDTIRLAERLSDLEIDGDDMAIYYSGNKGFHVAITLDHDITPQQFKQATTRLAQGLKTYDSNVCDPQRVLRLEHTINLKSGLFKIPLHIEEVFAMPMERIQEMAHIPRNDYEQDIRPVTTLPQEYFKVVEKKPKKKIEVMDKIDFSKKPRGIQDYVYAILEGHYGEEEGERHQALMVLAAKYRAMGYDDQATYYICKSSLKKQAARSGREEFNKEELYNNIIKDSIFSDRWLGGSYSPKNNEWLKKYCQSLGIQVDLTRDKNITNASELFDIFSNYSKNIDSLTIKTGIKELDAKLRLTIGMTAGLIAAPGVGKTSMLLQILENMSKQDHHSVFFSYDMYAPIVGQKLVQKHMNIGPDAVFETFNTNEKFRNAVKVIMEKHYSNVSFCFRTGQTVTDIVESIDEAEQDKGKKVKFIGMDYNELVITDYSEPTIASAFVAQKLREIAQTMDTHVFSLFQPTKMSGTPADEIRSYSSAKGSGAISQSCTVMLGMSRPGYDPKMPENDKYATIGCLKNRMGPLFSLDFGWEGIKGEFSSLNDDQREELRKIRDKKLEETRSLFE